MLLRSAKRVLPSVAAALTLLVAAPAFARPQGISGYSGKDGKICNDCHSGGTAPTVALAGPQQIVQGQSADYTFTVTTDQPFTGTDIAVSAGTLKPGNGLKILNNEVVQANPVATNNGATQYTVTITAPATPQAITLWAAGNAVNNDNGTGGDQAAGTMMTINVVAPPPPPAADAGANGTTPTGGNTSADGGTVNPAGGDGTGGPGSNVERRVPPDGGAKPFSAGSDEPYDPTFAQTGLQCTVGRTDAPIEPGTLALVGLALLAAGVRRSSRASREDA